KTAVTASTALKSHTTGYAACTASTPSTTLGARCDDVSGDGKVISPVSAGGGHFNYPAPSSCASISTCTPYGTDSTISAPAAASISTPQATRSPSHGSGPPAPAKAACPPCPTSQRRAAPNATMTA